MRIVRSASILAVSSRVPSPTTCLCGCRQSLIWSSTSMPGGTPTRAGIFDLVGRIPLPAHGIGLSIGPDEPLDLAYLDQVAEVVERLDPPAYSEHLAFTKVPGRDLANLLPLPKTEEVA